MGGLRWFLLSAVLLVRCSSTPSSTAGPAPEWIHQTTRTVDSGYIVYIGQGQHTSSERAVFNAEAVAIGDLTNECSFAPKGARIEDRYVQQTDGVYYAYAKLGLTFEECEGAKKATDPDAIRAMANVAMAEEWKRYQDIYYSADNNPPTAVAQAPSAPSSGQPATGGGFVVVNSSPDYFILRQQVAYVKQGVILAPAGTYVPGAPASSMVMKQLTPATGQIHGWEAHNPTTGNVQAWSAVQKSSGFRAPPGMATHINGGNQLAGYRGMARPPAQQGFNNGGGFGSRGGFRSFRFGGGHRR